jgi:hypothetical protein
VLRCVEPRLAVLKMTVVLFRCSVTGVNKLMLQLAKVNGLVKYSDPSLVLGLFIALRPMHSGIKQNAESTAVLLN